MNTDEIDHALRQTLDDRRLSRSEKRALGEVLQDLNPDAPQMAFIRHRIFELARQSVQSPSDRQIVDWLEDVLKLVVALHPPKSAHALLEAYFSPGHDCSNKIVSLVNGAKKSLDICVFTITDDSIAKATLDAHRRGVAIRVITDDEKAEDIGSDVALFDQLGIPVRKDRSAHHMHNKFAVFDGSLVLTGSYNWTRGAAIHNEENFIVSDDAHLVSVFALQFETLWTRFQP